MNRVFLFLVLAMPALAPAQSQFGSVTYTIPAGWDLAASTEGLLIFEPAAGRLQPIEGLVLALMLPAPVQQSVSDALDQAYHEALVNLTVQPEMDAGKLYETLPPIQIFDGRTLLIGQGRCSNADGTYDLRVYLLQDKQVYLRAFCLANLLPLSIAFPPTSAMYNPQFAFEIPGFVLQLSTGAPLDPPSQPPQSLSGLWRGLSMFGGDLKEAYAYFYSDGRAYFASSLPMNGFDGLAPDALAAVTPSVWGRYTFDGQQGEILFPYRNNEAFPFTAAGNQFTVVTTGTPHEFTSQASVDGSTFEGTYFLQLPSGDKPTLSLSANGHFVDQGVLKYVDHWIYPFRVSDTPGDGTYAVTNFTIVLRYSDGRLLRLAFSGLDLATGDPSPPTLAIGTEDDSLTRSSTPQSRIRVVADPANAGRLQIRWPTAATGFVLQATESLTPEAWGPAPELPVADGTENVVTVPTVSPARFFRLVKQ